MNVRAKYVHSFCKGLRFERMNVFGCAPRKTEAGADVAV